MSVLQTLIEQHQTFLHHQKQIGKAIQNRDERFLLQLKQESEEVFLQIEKNLGVFGNPEISLTLVEKERSTRLEELVPLLEQGRRLVRENEELLQLWLHEMKAMQQDRRFSNTNHGILATYVQQKHASPHQSHKNLKDPSHQSDVALETETVLPSSPNPWELSKDDSEIMGRQVNQQS